MTDVPIIDQPRWPALDAIAVPARLTFTMTWKSLGDSVYYENSSQQFRFTDTRAECRLAAQVEMPSIGFFWKSDPIESSNAEFAIMEEERKRERALLLITGRIGVYRGWLQDELRANTTSYDTRLSKYNGFEDSPSGDLA